MLDLTDWNCDLLSSIPAQSSIDLSNVLESLRFLYDTHGFSRFCMMPQYDCTKEPVSVFLLKRASYEDALKMALPSSISVQYGAKVLMRKGLSQTSDLVTLADQTAGLLPLLLPLAEYQD